MDRDYNFRVEGLSDEDAIWLGKQIVGLVTMLGGKMGGQIAHPVTTEQVEAEAKELEAHDVQAP